MATRVRRGLAWILFAALSISTVSCEGGSAVSSSASSKRTMTYKCLSSSCDATVTCEEGAPVPTHCGKPMFH